MALAHSVEMSFDHAVGNGPGAAVDEQNGIDRHGNPPEND